MYRHCNLKPAKAGFSLLEVLIVMAILSGIGLGLYLITSNFFKARESSVHFADFYTEIRLATNVLNQDVSLLFNPAMILPDLKKSEADVSAEKVQLANLLQGEENITTDFWLEMTDITGVRPSRFIGSDNAISFVAVSNVRVYKSSAESNFLKVRYELRNETDEDRPKDSQVLYRVVDTNAFGMNDHNEKSKKSYPILHGITKIRYQYYYKEKETWHNRWDTESSDFKGLYPDLIKMEIQLKGPDNENFEGVFVFKPEIPLNGIKANT